MSKPSQLAAMLKAAIVMQEPFFLKGPVGVGKSQITRQVCKDLGYELIDVRLSQMDPTDIKGFPCPDPVKKVMHWLPADFLPPSNAKTKGLLFLDELNNAPPAVQASAYQLTLDRCVGSYTLPKGWSVGAAGNRAIDRSIVNQTPAALNNRMIHMEFEPDLADFVAHARANNIDDVNIAFLRFKADLLHKFDPAVNPEAFPTPRGWFKVDKIMKAVKDPDVAFDLISGVVGKGTAIDHRAFREIHLSLPTLDEIAVAPDHAPVPTMPAALHAITTSLGSATTVKAFSKYLVYVARLPREWQVVYIRDAIDICRGVMFTKEFNAWSMANQDINL